MKFSNGRINLVLPAWLVCWSISAAAVPIDGVLIDNDRASSEQGYWAVDLFGGGWAFDAYLTGTGASGTVYQA